VSGAIPPLPQYAFIEWRSVKAQLYLLPTKTLIRLHVISVHYLSSMTQAREEVYASFIQSAKVSA
jgi:hypothetical protein